MIFCINTNLPIEDFVPTEIFYTYYITRSMPNLTLKYLPDICADITYLFIIYFATIISHTMTYKINQPISVTQQKLGKMSLKSTNELLSLGK